MIFSAARREAIPERERIFWRRSSIRESYLSPPAPTNGARTGAAWTSPYRFERVSLRITLPLGSTISSFMMLSQTVSWIVRVWVPATGSVPEEGLRMSALPEPALHVRLERAVLVVIPTLTFRTVPPETGQSGVAVTTFTCTQPLFRGTGYVTRTAQLPDQDEGEPQLLGSMEGDGEGEGLELGDGLGDGLELGDGLGEGLEDGLGLGDGDPVGTTTTWTVDWDWELALDDLATRVKVVVHRSWTVRLPWDGTDPMELSIVTVSAPETFQESVVKPPAWSEPGLAVKLWMVSPEGAVRLEMTLHPVVVPRRTTTRARGPKRRERRRISMKTPRNEFVA
jgi:hypothetical protein